MIFWSFKVNAAIAGLGIPPTTFDGQLRSHVQTLGQKAKLTPQETALVLVALVMGIGAPTDLELFVSVWHHDGKVDYEKPEVIDALYDVGCPVADPHWEHDAINLLRGTTDKAAIPGGLT